MSKQIIIQDDLRILLPTNGVNFSEVRDAIIRFAEIYQSPDSLYIFKLTNLSIWNAAANGVSKNTIIETLKKYSENNIPNKVLTTIDSWYDVYGLITLHKHNSDLLVLIKNPTLLNTLLENKTIKSLVIEKGSNGFIVNELHRGEIKSRLMKLGYPVEDRVGFVSGDFLDIESKDSIMKRPYQIDAVNALYAGGNGVAVAPCGSGKTVIGILLVTKTKKHTLIVTNNKSSVNQWKKSILDMTTLTEDQISIYDPKKKNFAPVTITTYNMIGYKKDGEFIHFKEFQKQNWGLFIGDEVHLAPANTFRVISALQSIRRIGLTATLVREDGREIDIFTLIGVKRYEKPWKDLENQGYIARLDLNEIRIPLTEEDRKKYNQATNGVEKFEIASTSKNKTKMVRMLLEQHKANTVLIIGQHTQQLIDLGKELNLPVVYGETPDRDREKIYDEIRSGKRKVFVASKVANAALDIPNLEVLIQISFHYSSRNEEGQRQGRISRPNKKMGYSYTIISEDTVEEKYNHQRMTFLTNEGYKYQIKKVKV